MLLMLLGAALAAEAPPPADDKAKPASKTMICREHQRATGTRIRTGRRCKTEEQWEMEDAERERMPTTMRIGDRRDTSTNTPQ